MTARVAITMALAIAALAAGCGRRSSGERIVPPAPAMRAGLRAAPDDRTIVEHERVVVIGGASGGAIAVESEARERIRTFCLVHGLDLAGFAEFRAPRLLATPTAWRGTPWRFGTTYWNAVYLPTANLEHGIPMSVTDERGRVADSERGVPGDGGYYFFVDADSGRVACKQASSTTPMPR